METMQAIIETFGKFSQHQFKQLNCGIRNNPNSKFFSKILKDHSFVHFFGKKLPL